MAKLEGRIAKYGPDAVRPPRVPRRSPTAEGWQRSGRNVAAGRGKKRANETRKENREARASISVKGLTQKEKDKHARRERRKWDQQAKAARDARIKVDKRAVAGRKNQLRDRTEALRRRSASPGSSASSAPLRQIPVRRIAGGSDDEQQPALTPRRKQDIAKGLHSSSQRPGISTA
jgi:hypothetical protein